MKGLNKMEKNLNENAIAVWEKMRYYCKYGYISYDENRIGSWTCHNKDNQSFEGSWGDCDIKLCQLLKK